eukprot:TRINITY_DN1827_c0_g1_i2.p1 TRINITY_DN1827_c0_g1~~TRINITY_DN1827_c0_g1_i2.p1  ORF type:complete len:246 (+),score=61.98 TRINITY_DN1827_c0_g1_i2:84-740(+)
MSTLPPKPKEYRLKIVIVGNLNAGKTSIIKRYTSDNFDSVLKPTVGVDFALKVIEYDERTRVRLQLWDVAGQERFGSMTKIYYKNAVGALIVYDLAARKTFDAVENWRKDLADKLQLEEGVKIPIMLVGNKCDMVSPDHYNPQVEELDNYIKTSESNIVDYQFVSAKENVNIESTLKKLVDHVLEYVIDQGDEESDEEIIRPHQRGGGSDSSGPCCSS